MKSLKSRIAVAGASIGVAAALAGCSGRNASSDDGLIADATRLALRQLG